MWLSLVLSVDQLDPVQKKLAEEVYRGLWKDGKKTEILIHFACIATITYALELSILPVAFRIGAVRGLAGHPAGA